MSLTSEILSKPISLDAIRSLLASENGYMQARFILQQIVSRGGLFGVTVAEASRLLDLLDAREGKADTSSSTILNIINQQADGASIEESMNALGERGIGFDELLAYLEGEILSEPDRALRQKKAYLGSMLGSKLAVAEMKPNADFAKLDDGQVLAPTPGKDLGAAFLKNTDGNRVRPIFLDDGEFVISREAVEGFGLEAGASEEEAHQKGIELLREMHGRAREARSAITPALPQLIRKNEDGGFEATEELVERVIQTESTGRPDAVSPTGAVGLMQILPSTAADPGFGVKGLRGDKDEIAAQLLDPDINRELGQKYLNAMLNRYGGSVEKALLAYNQGPAVADSIKGRNVVLDGFSKEKYNAASEGLDYVDKVLGYV